MKLHNKRAQLSITSGIGNIIVRTTFMIFVALSIIFITRHFLVSTLDLRNVEEIIIMNRLYYSPSCISYTDPYTQRSIPGEIDLSHFNEVRLDSCLNYSSQNDYLAAKLSLYYLDSSEKKEALYNKVGYDLLKPRVGIGGPGGAKSTSDWRQVNIIDSGKKRQAILSMEILTPNS
jgi:hypothetical protein